MTTSDNGVVSLLDDTLASTAATLNTKHPKHTSPATFLWSSGFTGDRRRSHAFVDMWEVDHVERVLTPLFVTLISVSNLVLLGHEARVVWRTQRLIPPKLLVLALSSADLLATLAGFLPLWILFVVPGELTIAKDSGTTAIPLSDPQSPSLLLSTTSTSRNTATTTTTTSTTSLQPNTAVQTVGYSIALFLLTSFWTLAQCIVVVMGIERFLALRAPYFYSARCTCKAFLLVVSGLALVSCGVAAFHLVVHLEEVTTHLLVFAGFLDSHSLAHNVFTLVQGLVWTVVLLLCNWAVTRELRRMEQTVTVMRMKDHSDYMKQLSMVHGAGREFARFMMAVNILFLLSACPNLVCVLLRLCNRSPRFSVQYFCWRMSHVSALLNPFLYGFLRKSLRSRIRRFVNTHVTCLRPHRVGEEDPGPSVRYQNNDVGHHETPCSAIMPRDPEASLVHVSE